MWVSACSYCNRTQVHFPTGWSQSETCSCTGCDAYTMVCWARWKKQELSSLQTNKKAKRIKQAGWTFWTALLHDSWGSQRFSAVRVGGPVEVLEKGSPSANPWWGDPSPGHCIRWCLLQPSRVRATLHATSLFHTVPNACEVEAWIRPGKWSDWQLMLFWRGFEGWRQLHTLEPGWEEDS